CPRAALRPGGADARTPGLPTRSRTSSSASPGGAAVTPRPWLHTGMANSMSDRATYINRDNEIVYPPPYEQADTFLTAWALPCPKDKQRAILDAQLNTCSGGRPFEYRPLLSRALLVLANIGKVSCLGAGAPQGWIPEVDICTWLLCGAYKLVNGRRELDHLVWYVPYIWVTTADTMATGREVFGYPKAIGWAQLPQDPDDP